MELLHSAVLRIFATALVVCIGTTLIGILPIWARRTRDKTIPSIFLAILAFTTLGFITGDIIGSTSESVVGEVFPAVLALLAGIAAYIVGSKGIEAQASVASMVLCFAITLFVGSIYGTQLRYEYTAAVADPVAVRERALAAEQNRLAVEVQRLQNYITFLKLKQGFADQEKLDLSKFGSTLEEPIKPTK